MSECREDNDAIFLDRLRQLVNPPRTRLQEDHRREIAVHAAAEGRRILRRRRAALMGVPIALVLAGASLLFVSTGRNPISAHGSGGEKHVVVPNVVRLPLPVARDHLIADHLRLRILVRGHGVHQLVIFESPAPRTSVPVNTAVTLVVTSLES